MAKLLLFCLTSAPALSANSWEEGRTALLGSHWTANTCLPPPTPSGAEAGESSLQDKLSIMAGGTLSCPFPTSANLLHQQPTTKLCVLRIDFRPPVKHQAEQIRGQLAVMTRGRLQALLPYTEERSSKHQLKGREALAVILLQTAGSSQINLWKVNSYESGQGSHCQPAETPPRYPHL